MQVNVKELLEDLKDKAAATAAAHAPAGAKRNGKEGAASASGVGDATVADGCGTTMGGGALGGEDAASAAAAAGGSPMQPSNTNGGGEEKAGEGASAAEVVEDARLMRARKILEAGVRFSGTIDIPGIHDGLEEDEMYVH